MAELRWTPQSLEDIEAICLFIARDAPPIANIFADRVFQAAEMLEEFPYSGRVVPEIGSDEIREIILGNYRLVYRCRGEIVEMLTLHHAARLLGPRLGESGV